MRIEILGIPIDILSQDDAVRRISELFRAEGKFQIATPNPEMLVETRKNPEFKSVLQKADINLPDGAGLVWAMRWRVRVRHEAERNAEPPARVEEMLAPRGRSLTAPFGLVRDAHAPPPVRITGTDTLLRLCSSASRICPPERIFLLGAAPGVAEKAAEKLKEKNHLLKEIGTFSGSPRIEDEEEIIAKINAFQPTLLFVAFGAPAQELWIARNLPKLKTVKVAMGVGGAFDFISGKRKRAPKFMQKIGCEWLWRLVLEPKRFRRILNAVIVFPFLIITQQLACVSDRTVISSVGMVRVQRHHIFRVCSSVSSDLAAVAIAGAVASLSILVNLTLYALTSIILFVMSATFESLAESHAP